ncbi:hypothetical protein ES703_43343 [subsurface metagenome]
MSQPLFYFFNSFPDLIQVCHIHLDRYSLFPQRLNLFSYSFCFLHVPISGNGNIASGSGEGQAMHPAQCTRATGDHRYFTFEIHNYFLLYHLIVNLFMR